MSINKYPTAVICLSPNAGGMELDALKLAKLLDPHIDVTLILQEKHFIHEQCLQNTQYSNLKFETIKFHKTFSPSIIFHARRIIKEKNIKNVIFLGASELKSLYFAFLNLNINLIVRHGTTKSTPKKDLFHKLIYSNISYHIAISKHLAKNIQKIIPFGKRTQLKTIIPSLINPPSTLEKTTSNKLRLIHIGRITPGKGLKEALEASDILYKNNISFAFNSFGEIDKSYKQEFQAFINSLPYKNSFKLCGFTNNIYDEYPKHDIFIFPSKGEGFGNVIMEALSHGIIILAFDNTAISDFKEMGFHLHLVENQNTIALKEKLLHIAQNFKDEQIKAKKNISLAKQIFSPNREANEYIELLK